MNWNYEDSYVVSVWANKAAAEAKLSRLAEEDNKKRNSWDRVYGTLEVIPFELN